MEQSMKARMARMEKKIKEKADENKKLRDLVAIYKKENAKLKNNCDRYNNQNFEVRSDTGIKI